DRDTPPQYAGPPQVEQRQFAAGVGQWLAPTTGAETAWATPVGGGPLRSQNRVAGNGGSPSEGSSRARTTNVDGPSTTAGNATSTLMLLPGSRSVVTGIRRTIGSVAGPHAGIAVTRSTVEPGSAARPVLLSRTIAFPGPFGSTDAR